MLRACSAVTGFDCAIAADAASDSKTKKRMGTRLYRTGEWRTVESAEHAPHVAYAELGLSRRGEQATQVRGHRQAADLVSPGPLNAGPDAATPPSADAAPEHA